MASSRSTALAFYPHLAKWNMLSQVWCNCKQQVANTKVTFQTSPKSCHLTRQRHVKSRIRSQRTSRSTSSLNRSRMPNTSWKSLPRFFNLIKNSHSTILLHRQSKSPSVFDITRTISVLKCSTQLNPVTKSLKNCALKSTTYHLRCPGSLWSVKVNSRSSRTIASCMFFCGILPFSSKTVFLLRRRIILKPRSILRINTRHWLKQSNTFPSALNYRRCYVMPDSGHFFWVDLQLISQPRIELSVINPRFYTFWPDQVQLLSHLNHAHSVCD